MTAKLKLLVIEDDHLVLRGLQRAFARHDQVELLTASTLAEGRQRVTDHLATLDTILSDINLPDGDSLELYLERAEDLRRLGILFLVMTGEIGSEAARQYRGLGVEVHSKPFVSALEFVDRVVRESLQAQEIT